MGEPTSPALLYLVSGVLFILALRGLSSPATSRQGNRFGIAGMTDRRGHDAAGTGRRRTPSPG